MRTVGLIAAGGKGLRMGANRPKQFLPLKGMPILARTVKVFNDNPGIEAVIVAAPSGEGAAAAREILEPYAFSKLRAVVEGGGERQDSVRAGLEALPPWTDRVAVHDGVRPLLPPDILSRALKEAAAHPAVVVAVRVKDTIKVSDGNGFVLATPVRHELWAAQTPQIFEPELLRRAYLKAYEDGFLGTDDAVLVERTGSPVRLVEGSEVNIKITTPNDIALAELLLERE